MEANRVSDKVGEEFLTVAELLFASREHLRDRWPTRVWVVGELSNVRRYPSGHVYMTLKDEQAEVSCIMYSRTAQRHPPLPGDGTKVSALAEPTIYVQKGRFQLVVQEIRVKGKGRLHEEYLLNKERLRESGWFDADRKRDIHKMPSSVAVVVSLQGAAWRDVRKTLGERFPMAKVKVFAAPAQGPDAAERIAEAIGDASSSGCDTMLVCRGGGSFEDLWSYNEVVVATAIRESSIPVITGIGHETDETIADLVADHRAATPTGAAVAAVPSRVELTRLVAGLGQRLQSSVRQVADDSRQSLDDATSAMHRAHESVSKAAWRLERQAQDLRRASGVSLGARHDRLKAFKGSLRESVLQMRGAGVRLSGLSGRMAATASSLTSSRNKTLESLSARLRAMSPRRTLERGYAIVTGDGNKVKSRSSQLRASEAAVVTFADGAVGVTVGEVQTGNAGALGNVE